MFDLHTFIIIFKFHLVILTKYEYHSSSYGHFQMSTITVTQATVNEIYPAY